MTQSHIGHPTLEQLRLRCIVEISGQGRIDNGLWSHAKSHLLENLCQQGACQSQPCFWRLPTQRLDRALEVLQTLRKLSLPIVCLGKLTFPVSAPQCRSFHLSGIHQSKRLFKKLDRLAVGKL